MSVLTAILTHLPPDGVRAQLEFLAQVCPDSRFIVCHGGLRHDFDALEVEGAIFIEDPSLRGPHFAKSLNDTLQALFNAAVRDDSSVDLVYVIEYDHLILRPDFESALRDLADSTGAGLLAKAASPRNDSNWPHFLLSRRDEGLNRFIASISRRDDPGLRLGCLGTGLLFRREALEAFCAMRDAPAAYVELFVPTAVHHLGFDVADVDALSDLYADIRWLPEYDVEETLAARHAGRIFVHPFKRLEALRDLSPYAP